VSALADTLRSLQGLDPLGRRVLDLERSWATRRGPRGRAIRERLGLSPARYHQVLLRTIALPEALAYDPVLVGRLRRLRDARRRARRAGRLGLADDHG
jgi:Protein of unknown function (DUF3263)